MRDNYINFLDYYYSEHHEDEMDIILQDFGAVEHASETEGFYGSMSDAQLRQAANKFVNSFGSKYPEMRYLIRVISGPTQEDYEYLTGWQDAYRSLGKDISELEEKIGL